jgi:hypothetical protein
MKWYVVIKVFYVLWASFGPYETKEECHRHMKQMYDEGMSRYNSGERVTFMGKTVEPRTVKMVCQKK